MGQGTRQTSEGHQVLSTTVTGMPSFAGVKRYCLGGWGVGKGRGSKEEADRKGQALSSPSSFAVSFWAPSADPSKEAAGE